MEIFLKRTLLALLLTISNLSICQDSLKIMTYNIQGMKPGTFPGLRLGFIIDKIKTLDPDIIGLQEINESLNVSDNQCQQIAHALSEHFNITYTCYQQFTHLSWDNQFREFIGIITKYPVIDSGYHQLATGVFPRKVVWNYIDTPMGMVHFFNTHLSFNSPSVRLEQAGQIIAYINQVITADPASAVLLTGDFNDTPEALSVQLITNPESDTTFIDSYALTNPGMAGYTVPSNAPDSRIDYIFSGNISSLTADTSFVVSDSAIIPNLYSSDHLAVLSVFKESVNSTGTGYRTHPDIQLLQNYPNPFDGFTSISYKLRIPAHVKLTVTDLFGIEIDVLTDAIHQPGEYTIRYDASKLPGGVYFYTLKSNLFSQTMKMLLFK